MPVDLIPLLVIGGWILLSASIVVPLVAGIRRGRQSRRDTRRRKVRPA